LDPDDLLEAIDFAASDLGGSAIKFLVMLAFEGYSVLLTVTLVVAFGFLPDSLTA
jgi:hypothetical protein